jgi:hypothetical protein
VNRSTQKTPLTSTPPLVGGQSRNGRRPTRSALLKEIGLEGASIPCSEATATGAGVSDEGYGVGCLRPSETHKHLFLREKLQGRDTSADPAALERQVASLAADLGHPAPILVLQEKALPCAPLVLPPRALSPGGLLARLEDRRTVTVRTLHGDRDQRLPPRTIIVRGNGT